MSLNKTSKLLVLALLLLPATVLFAQPDIEYQKRGEYYEGVRPKPVSGYDIEVLSALVDYKEPTDRLPDQIRVRFYLDNKADIHLIIREQDYRLFYWLDKVKRSKEWRPHSHNEFEWLTGNVLRKLDQKLDMYDLGVLVRLRKETPASVEDVAPAILYHTELPKKVDGYLFTMKINGDARLSCSMYREGEASAVMTKTYQRIPGGRPFTVRWEATAQEAPYSLVCKGYFLDSNQLIQQTVRFYHKPTIK
jgi:hypothetical protein